MNFIQLLPGGSRSPPRCLLKRGGAAVISAPDAERHKVKGERVNRRGNKRFNWFVSSGAHAALLQDTPLASFSPRFDVA